MPLHSQPPNLELDQDQEQDQEQQLGRAEASMSLEETDGKLTQTNTNTNGDGDGDGQLQLDSSSHSLQQAPQPPPRFSSSSPQPHSEPQPVQQPHDANHQSWSIKHILWPPFQSKNQSHLPIILQNHNGPCSLLAISNILLLHRQICLPGPSTRSEVDFNTLSSLLADYLVNSNLDPTLLASALETIPSTRTGLDLNPRFGSIHGFRSSSQPGAAGLDLFRAANIPLVHGWLADAQDKDTWDVLVEKSGDYDNALQLVVLGQELQDRPPNLDRSQAELSKINDALLIRRFLDATSTQLSYPGLFQLASDLVPDSLAALLRNDHLSVLYRRPPLPSRPSLPLPPPPDQIEPGYSHETMLEVHAVAQQLAALELESDDEARLPKLFTLVTDHAFINEPEIVWESLEDVEGGLSEFYDWKLEKVPLKPRPCPPPQQVHGQSGSGHVENTDADFDLAHQLQEEEYRTAAESRARDRTRTHRQALPPPEPVSVSVSNGGPNSLEPSLVPVSSPGSSSRLQMGQSYPDLGKPKKKSCLVM